MIAYNVKYIPPARLCIVSTPDGRRAAIQGIDSREAAEAAAADVAARWRKKQRDRRGKGHVSHVSGCR